MRKVGKKYFRNSKFAKFHYQDVKQDLDGWADANSYLPADYDLMHLKIEGKDIISGWSIGSKWEGARLKKGDKILCWKKNQE